MASIVVVEDNPDSMKLFRALLARSGHTVAGLSNGTGLVDLVRERQPAVVLLDIQLPDRDGYQLLQDLRAAFGPDLFVVALTAHALQRDRETAFAAGFDGFITKPIDIKSFPAQVSQAIARERWTDPSIPGIEPGLD
jgi:two-component system cell cycle response regulator DivK